MRNIDDKPIKNLVRFGDTIVGDKYLHFNQWGDYYVLSLMKTGFKSNSQREDIEFFPLINKDEKAVKRVYDKINSENDFYFKAIESDFRAIDGWIFDESFKGNQNETQ